MNAKEKYEVIIDSIEKMIEENELNDHEISDKAFSNADFPREDREKNVLFEFLMGKRVLEYISERRLMIGYKILLNEKNKDIAYRRATDISGSSYAQGYITKFKKRFGMSPLKAREKNNAALYQTTPSWEEFSASGKEEKMDIIEILFNLPQEYTNSVKNALNLRDFYNLNDEESKFAYSLCKNGIEMDSAFEYIADYVYGNKDENRDDSLKKDLSREDVKYLYFDCDYGFNQIFLLLLMQYIGQISKPIIECDRRFLDGCLDYLHGNPYEIIRNRNKDVSFQEKYDYYCEMVTEQYTDMDMELYLLYIGFYEYKKAFSMINPGLDNIEELNRIKRIYGKEVEGDALYRNMEEKLDLEAYYYSEATNPWREQGIEPEIWDEDYMDPIPEEDDLNADEDDWIADAMEDDETYDVRELGEPFDVDEFENLCKEADSADEPEGSEKSISTRKRFTIRRDLDVEGFWWKYNNNFFEISSILRY